MAVRNWHLDGAARASALDLVVGALLVVPLLASIAAASATDPDWTTSFHLTLLSLVVVAVLSSIDVVRRDDPDPWLWLASIGLTAAAAGVVVALDRGLVATGPSRQVALLGVFALYLATVLAHVVQRGAVSARPDLSSDPLFVVWVASMAVVVGVYFVHAAGAPPGSGASDFAVGIGLLFALNVLVFPQYVSERVFFRTVAVLAAVLVSLGLLVYVVGPYQVLGYSVQLYRGRFDPLLGGPSLHNLQSVFVNPNALGVWAFAGTVTGSVELYRAAERRLLRPATPALALLVGVNAVGLYLTYNRASWLATAGALALFLTAERLGTGSMRGTLVVVGTAIAAFLAGIYLGALPVNPHGRFVIWLASLRAIVNAPTPLFGAGVVRTGHIIAPYLTAYRGYNTHNSYLAMFIRVGLVGGLAYLLLTAGAVIHRVVAGTVADAAVLALAFGFAIDLLFVSYTLYHFNAVPVLAALAFGYLVTTRQRSPAEPAPAPMSVFRSDRPEGAPERL